MKILLFNTLMEAGGAQKALLSLAKGLQDREESITVVTMYDKADFVPAFETEYGIGIVNLRMKKPGDGHLRNSLRALRGLWVLWRIMLKERFDVVQTFSHYANIIGMPIAAFAGVPVRVSSQRMSLRGLPGWVRFLDRVVARSRITSKMVAVSEGTREWCVSGNGIPPEKLLTIENGVRTERYGVAEGANVRRQLGIGLDTCIVLTVARLHPQKGHEYLLKAAPSIVAANHDVQFLFAGGGPHRKAVQDMVGQFGLEEHVELLGVRTDIPDLMAAADLFVLPSLWEGMPNVVLEAMASGLAVVATSVDGNPELVEHGETGLLVPPGDPESLSAAINQILSDPAARHSMGERGKARCQARFSLDHAHGRFLALYHELRQGVGGLVE